MGDSIIRGIDEDEIEHLRHFSKHG